MYVIFEIKAINKYLSQEENLESEKTMLTFPRVNLLEYVVQK